LRIRYKFPCLKFVKIFPNFTKLLKFVKIRLSHH